MKKIFFSTALSLTIISSTLADVDLSFSIGGLKDKSGVFLADGSLLQIILVKNGTGGLSTDSLASGSFLHSNEVLLGSFGLDSTTVSGIPGSSNISLQDLTLGGDLTTGTMIALRWWPTLTVTDIAPMEGNSYGQVNPLYIVDSVQTGTDVWEVPADGAGALYAYVSELLGGNVPDAALMASYQVVPEPSTYALGGMVLLGALVAVRRRKRI